MKKIVLINGGRGAGEILPFLEKNLFKVTSIVNAYDDGKSTGKLREYFHTLGPSDLRKVMKLMLNKKDDDYKSKINLFECRFPKKDNDIIIKELIKLTNFFVNEILDINKLNKNTKKFVVIKIKKFLRYYKSYKKKNKNNLKFSDLSLINCILITLILENKHKIDYALKIFCKNFNIKSKININSNLIRHLVALRISGKFLNSEAEIVESRSNIKISRIFLIKNKINKKIFQNKSFNYISSKLKILHSSPKLSKNSYNSIVNADIILFCPGTQHSSLYPTYMSNGFEKALIENVKCKKIFITNIGADYETPKYDAFDYLKGAYNYITNFDGKNNFNKFFDLVLINKAKIKSKVNYVKFSKEHFLKNKINYVYDDFEKQKKPGFHDIKKIYKYLK